MGSGSRLAVLVAMAGCGATVSGDPIVSGSESGFASGAADDSTSAVSPEDSSSSGQPEPDPDPDPPADCDWSQPGFSLTEPAPIEALNSPAFEGDPRLSADGLRLYFASQREGGLGGYDLYVAIRSEVDASFSTFHALSGLNSPGDDTSLTFGPHGGGYFSSRRDDPSGPSRIWSVRVDANSGEPMPETEATAINRADDNYDPLLSDDGLRLYFTSAPGDQGTNLWVATRSSVADSFASAEPLGLDSEAYDDSVTVSGDERVAVFGSGRAGGLGDHDLWFAHRSNVDEPFGPPELVPAVNTAAAERESFLTSDGCTLLFVSDRPGGSGTWDIYTSGFVRP